MVSGEHPNATAYRQTADAFRSGDLATLASLVDEHVIWHVPGPHQMAGDIRGRSAILRPGSIVFARKASGSSRTTCSDATIPRAP
jgi:ketosteroid isomerase-like protein